jgi:hypothetical protein
MALKKSSEIFTIGATVRETVANTFEELKIDVQLNPLDNEVLAIYAVDIQNNSPDAIGGSATEVRSAVYTTSQTALPALDQGTCLATASTQILSDAPGNMVSLTDRSLSDTPASSEIDYIGLVATSDIFFGVQGDGNVNAKRARVKIWARRMVADSATYAALVQSELLSN